MNLWHDLSAGDNVPEEITVIIECPRGTKNKYEIDKETGLIKLDRAMKTSQDYPMDYGFTHIPCVISYCIETPELYRPPPELPLFKSGTWVLIRCSSNYYKEHKADSDWDIILEHYRTINSNNRKRHQYTCAKWYNGRVSLSDQFDFNMFPEGITHPSSKYKKKLLKNLKRH